MATQKQRKRREKEKRHEYDLVEIDAEGNERVVTSRELKPDASATQAKDKATAKRAAPARQRGVPQPPTWNRVMKRAAIFGPIFFVMVLLLGGGKVSIAGALINAALLMAVFVPLSYLMDSFVWRTYNKRLAKNKS